MRQDIHDILVKLGFDGKVGGRSFRMVRNDIAVSLSTSFYDDIGIGFIPRSTAIIKKTSVFLIEKIKIDESDPLLTEVFVDEINYDRVREIVLTFFQSDIRERSLNYLLNS
jgi:hypothetical protein